MLATLRRTVRAATYSSPILFAFATVRAQVASGWAATYEDPALPHAYDSAYACTVATNGDVYVATYSSLYPAQSAAFLKYDANGTLLWTRSYAPFDAQYQRAFAAPGGGAFFVGRIESFSTGLSDFVVTRLDAAGNLSWTSTYAAQLIQQDYNRSVVDAAGNVVIVGTRTDHNLSYRVLFVRSYSPTGALNFYTESSAIGWPRLDDLAAMRNGGVVAIGVDFSAPGGFVAAFSSSGALMWSHASTSGAGAVAVDPSTGRVATAGGESTSAGLGAAVHCFDEAGNPLWSDFVLDPTLTSAALNDAVFASDGALWAAGACVVGPASHEFVLRYDASGARTATRVGAVRGEYVWSVGAGNAGQVWTCVSQGWGGRLRVEQLDVLGQLNWRFELARAGVMLLCGNSAGYIVASGFTTPGTSPCDAFVQQLDARASPDGYCTAQVNSLGCTPALTFAGNSSASEASGFVVSVNRVLNQKTGLMFYGTSGMANVPFHGGTLCVAGALTRSALLATGGSASPANDCSGALALDFNALASSSPALSTPGTTVYAQAWSHDPGAPSTTNLSSALHFVVLP
jgi:hypothetical protein